MPRATQSDVPSAIVIKMMPKVSNNEILQTSLTCIESERNLQIFPVASKKNCFGDSRV